MNTSKSIYKRHRFPPEIIQYAVWLYHRFNLSLGFRSDLVRNAYNYSDESYPVQSRGLWKFEKEARNRFGKVGGD